MDIPALPFCGLEVSAPLPYLKELENQHFVGAHIRRQRLKLRILQADLAERFSVCEDTITGWENGRNEPQIQFYPKIIQFLGYNPFLFKIETLGERMKKYRFENGLSQEDLANMVGVNESTIFHWEKNLHVPFPSKLKLLEEIIKSKEHSI